MEMNLLEPGRYIVAVSGGVDSMVLLDMLRQQPDVDIVVAHFDHGIRPDSIEDRKLVESYAHQHGLKFVYAEGKLGADASEETARNARYKFLQEQLVQCGAKAIVTAHHQDDLLETALLNMVRGTGRKGLTSLQSRDDIVRPLLAVTKQQIRDYATAHNIVWREDSTNTDTTYARNYIRLHVMPTLSDAQRNLLLQSVTNLQQTNKELDEALQMYLDTIAHEHGKSLQRVKFVVLPYRIRTEVMAAWLRQNGIRDFDKKTIERLVIAACTGLPGTRIDIRKGTQLLVDKTTLTINDLNSSNTSGQSV